jgi:hypothetical protein
VGKVAKVARRFRVSFYDATRIKAVHRSPFATLQ